MGSKKQALFVILPDEKTTFYPIASLIVSQQYELLAEAADRRGGRLERRVNFILDEYGNFTPISDMTNKLTVAAKCGYGVSTVKRALDELVKAGYIVKQARFDERKNGGQTSNLYTLCSDLPCPDEPENAPVSEDDASDESPAVQPESASADACNTPDPTPGEQSATLPTADSYSFADGFETKIGRQNCRPIRMWTGGQSIFIPP